MTGHESHEYSFTEALGIVSCSESTLRRKLHESGSILGATKLKKGWRIPVETLEALGVLKTVTGQSTERVTGHDRAETSQEITRLRIENATLRAENEGLKQLLSEREKVVALLEQSPRHESFWSRFTHRSERNAQ
jgi:regulator of replication initiation timing